MAEAESIQIARLEEQFSGMRMAMAEVVNMVKDARSEVRDLRDELEVVQRQLEQARGGWRTLMWLGGAAATLGSFITWAAAHVRLQ